MMKRVLWIEDSAFGENTMLAAPVNISGRYDLKIATTATEGQALLFRESFEAVIVDIRIPPGSSEAWIQAFQEAGSRKESARLGLRLLKSLFDPNLRNEEVPSWISPSRFGVLSVETREELESDLIRLGITAYRQKKGQVSKKILLELIDEVADMGIRK